MKSNGKTTVTCSFNAPKVPKKNDLWERSVDGEIFVFNGSKWVKKIPSIYEGLSN